MWRVKFRMWIFFTICVHSWSQMGTVGDGSMDRYRWYLLTLSINTFSLIFIDVIDPSVKDFFFWSIVLTIDHKSLLWPMAIDPTVHTESIVLINRSNCSKNSPNFRRFLPWRRKNTRLFLKNYFYFNKIIEGSINQLLVSIQSIYFLPAVPNYVHDRARKFDWIHYLALENFKTWRNCKGHLYFLKLALDVLAKAYSTIPLLANCKLVTQFL
jgi:hypothetical protein